MHEISDQDFEFIKSYLTGWKPKIRLGKDEDLRRFLNGGLWICRSGAQLREMPEKYGHWNTVYKRYADWGELGIWQGLLAQMAQADSDLEYVMVDSTIVRAHACCATGQKKRRRQRKDWDVPRGASPAKSI